MNPEPWTRSIVWLAIAAVVIVSLFHGEPIKISGGGVTIEKGGETIPEKDSPPAPGGLKIIGNVQGTKYVSVCPPKTRAIAGSCTLKAGNTALQNFGPEQSISGAWQFACVWTSPVQAPAVQAVCLSTQ